MTSVTAVLFIIVPLVPVTVTMNDPVGVVLRVVTVIVVEPEPVTEVGLKVAVAPVGNPLAPKVTAPLKPFNAPIVTV